MTPPQGRPLLVHAGQSEGGRDLAARYADAIFAAVRTKAASQELRADILERARRFGRDPKEIKFLPGMTPRSEEHTSELQSLMRISYAAFCLNKKNTPKE